MLADLGCRIVEIGHSERRREHGEDPPLIARKAAAVVRWGMRPLLCVGEPVQGEFHAVAAQLIDDLERCLAAVAAPDRARVLVAYEPVWAIGAGAQAASAEHVARVHEALHGWLERWSANASIPVLYGGSVDGAEAQTLLAEPSVDGLFVGRHALDPLEFARIAWAGLPRALEAPEPARGGSS
jgi:triosephosphate isomerase